MARWCAWERGRPEQVAAYQRQAILLTRDLAGGDVLDVAPGPGLLAVEMARLGHFAVTGMDLSATIPQIAAAHAADAGVTVRWLRGHAAHLPLPAQAFDRIDCQSALQPISEGGKIA